MIRESSPLLYTNSETLRCSIKRSMDSDAHILREDNAAFLPGGLPLWGFPIVASARS